MTFRIPHTPSSCSRMTPSAQSEVKTAPCVCVFVCLSVCLSVCFRRERERERDYLPPLTEFVNAY